MVDKASVVAKLNTAISEVQGIGTAPAPTITSFTATPGSLPVGGGPVQVSAAVVGATSYALTFDGVNVPLPPNFPAVPVTVNVT